MKTAKNQSLEAKLDSYCALSNSDRTADRKRNGTWMIYAAAAGSSLAMTTAADAGIIYSSVNQSASFTPNASGTGSANVKFNIDGAQFELQALRYFTGPFPNGAAQLLGPASLDSAGGHLLRLSSGNNISAGGQFYAALGGGVQGLLYHHTSTGANLGFWHGTQPGFAGIEFSATDGNHFGWARLSFQNAPPAGGTGGYPKSVKVIDWAYNTVAGQSINAGQETAPTTTPEPATSALALLAAGALALRKRQLRGRKEA